MKPMNSLHWKRMFAMLEKLQAYWSDNPSSLLRLALCVGIFVGCYLFSRLVRYKLVPWFVKKAEARTKKGMYVIAKGFAKPVPVFLWSIGLYVAFIMLPIPTDMLAALRIWLDKAFRINLIALLAWGLIGSSDIAPLMMQRVQGTLDLETDQTVTSFLNRILKGIVLVFAIVMVLDVLGFPVTSLLTSLGLVGLTVSLAAKDYASNFFGGLIVIMEKPFSIGDWIKTSAGEGAVEDISFRSTQIRTLDDSLLTVPNSILTSNPLTNYSRIQKRLAKYTLGVTYSTSREQLETLLASIRAMLAGREDVWDDSIRVQLTGFSASSIDILVQFYVRTGVLVEFLQVQEQVNLELMGLVHAAGTSFAFPSTSVYLEQK